MMPPLTIIHPDGDEEGPYTEAELLTLVQSGEVKPSERCRVGHGPVQSVGEIFQVIHVEEPEEEEELDEDLEADEDLEPEADREPEEDSELEAERDPADEFPEASEPEFTPPGEELNHAEEFFPDLAQTEAPAWQPLGRMARRSKGASLAVKNDVSTEDSDTEESDEDATDDAENDADADGQNDPEDESDAAEAPAIVYQSRPSLMHWPRALLSAFVALVLGWLGGGDSPVWPILGLIIATLIVVGLVALRSLTRYRITSSHAEITSGLWQRVTQEIPLAEIRSISVVQTGVLGLLGVGTIHFSAESGNEEDIAFRGIHHPQKVRRLLRV